jgi:NTE family protein
MRFALVLGGGGITGIGWETGLLHGLYERGLDLAGAELIVGTSAGSVVGAQLATVGDIAALYARQLVPPDPTTERPAGLDLREFARVLGGQILPDGPIPQEARAHLGQAALAAATAPEEERLATFRARLPIHDWPTRALRITAVDAEDGRFVVWDRAAGVPLVRAVASSCAVPLVYPPTTVGARRYIDGGMRSGTNADLAEGYPLVIVLAPMAGIAAGRGALNAEIAALRASGSRVVALWPDADALAAIGPNPLDPARRVAAAEAGHAQAASAATALRDVGLGDTATQGAGS